MAQKEQVTVAGNSGEQIVKIMGNAPSKLSDSLHLLTLGKLRFQRFKLGRVM